MHGPLATTSRDRCAHVVAPRARDAQRLAALPGVTSPAYQWSIEASVVPEMPFGLQLLAFAHDPSPTDVDVPVTYANLFPDTTPYAQVAVSAVNTITYPDADPLERRSTQITRHLPAEDDCSVPTAFSGDPAIPIDVTLGGVAATGNVTIDRSTEVELAWSLDGTEAVDYFLVTLFEVESVAASPRPRTVLRLHREFFTEVPRVLIDPDVLARGARYVAQISAFTGTPGANQGDFATTGTGSTLVQTLSPMFQVR
jgi:hypothetical protein